MSRTTQKLRITLGLLLPAFLLVSIQGPLDSQACTNFQLKSQDGAIVIGRSMEFAPDLKSQIVAVPKGYVFKSTAPGGASGVQWTGRYGFFGVNAYGMPIVVDGMNEAGLGIGFLWLPESQYQGVPAGQEGKALSITDLGNWLLSQFATVDEVRQALPNVLVWGEIVPQLGILPPLHLTINDAKGKNLVVEYVGGQLKMHDNPIGALTNSPLFDWQMTNLRNYVNIGPNNAAARTVAGVKLSPTGQGSGLLGLPGDWTPPSRFVRAAIFSHAVDPGATFEKTVNVAFHILNTFDIPRGLIRETGGLNELTQWIVVKDLTHRSLSFRGYDDLTIRRVDTSLLNGLAAPEIKTMAFEAVPAVAKP